MHRICRSAMPYMCHICAIYVPYAGQTGVRISLKRRTTSSVLTCGDCAKTGNRHPSARAGPPGQGAGRTTPADLARSDVPPDDVVHDVLLRLTFTCCHPTLSLPTRIALAPRTLCGLSPAQIAHVLLSTEDATTKQLAQARRKFAAAHTPTGCRPRMSWPNSCTICFLISRCPPRSWPCFSSPRGELLAREGRYAEAAGELAESLAGPGTQPCCPQR